MNKDIIRLAIKLIEQQKLTAIPSRKQVLDRQIADLAKQLKEDK